MTGCHLDAAAVAARLAAADPPAGAGVLAAHAVVLTAALCESLARASAEAWPEARGIAVQSVQLRRRAGEALAANARAYARAREWLRPATATSSQTGRDAMLRAALLDAADTLLRIGIVAEDCAGVAAVIAHGVGPDLAPDAVAAAELAVGAATSVELLVGINLALLSDDRRREEAAALRACARRSSDEARRALAH